MKGQQPAHSDSPPQVISALRELGEVLADIALNPAAAEVDDADQKEAPAGPTQQSLGGHSSTGSRIKVNKGKEVRPWTMNER